MKKLIFLMLFGIPSLMHAQEEKPIEPIAADRPDQTETPSIVPKGMFQMETGFAVEKYDGNSESLLVPTILMKIGVNDNFEIRLITETTKEQISDSSSVGINPLLIGIKVKLADEKGIIPKTSFLGHLLIPKLATSNRKADYYAPELRLTMEHTLSEKIKLGYNLGAEWNGETPEPTFIYTITSGFDVTDHLGTFIEFYGFAPQQDRADHRFDFGLTYLISNNFMVDASGGFGITDNAPDYFASFGFSFRL